MKWDDQIAECCANCEFSSRITEIVEGFEDNDPRYPGFMCRRFPPSVSMGQGDAFFPGVWSDTWCGEYKRAE